MTTNYYFVEPLDVLMLRGNKSFGEAGQHGESIMPPWPSLFAGAFRSMLLGDDPDKLARFVAIGTDKNLSEDDKCTRIREVLGERMFAALGTPTMPGDFRIVWLSLAQCLRNSATPAIPLPADIVAFNDTRVTLAQLRPSSFPPGSAGSCELELPLTPFLRISRQVKPEEGRWLDGDGLAAYLSGNMPDSTTTTDNLYKRETRLGIALNVDSRTAETGAIYTTDAVSFSVGKGFLVGVTGHHDQLPEEGILRLGGDGKGARYRRVDFSPNASHPLKAGGRFRLVLATPGLFTKGWLPNGASKRSDGYYLKGNGFSARLVCAAVNRHDVISGWDLANWRPKTAHRVAPAGSVYWFDDLQGDPHNLAQWVENGLWADNTDAQRRTEGFNRAWLVDWSNE